MSHTLLGISSLSQQSCSARELDRLEAQRGEKQKLVWFFRHGQSEANVAKEKAIIKDVASGLQCLAWCKCLVTLHQDVVYADPSLKDSGLTDKGKEQAKNARKQVSGWNVKPTLVVSSPITRAIQTAAIVFEEGLVDRSIKLVIRPELREFFPRMQENMGRPLQDLRCHKELTILESWPAIERALAPDATESWESFWDERADGELAKDHINSPDRLREFKKWLLDQKEERIAIVSHWGTTMFLLEEEASGSPKDVPNCGWVAALTKTRTA